MNLGLGLGFGYALRTAASYDFNHDGYIKYRGFGKEIRFDGEAKRRTDWNRDGHITVEEFANALHRGDVFIGYDREVHSSNPFSPPSPGYPGGGSPYYPSPGPVTYPGPGYGYGYGYGGGYGNVVGGAVIGGAIGYVADGKNGLGKGAVIGGVIGAIGSLFN